MTFAAKYAGYCHSEDCDYGDHRIGIGDECDYVENEIMHSSCASRAKIAVPLCQKCWQYHRGECL